MPFFNVQVSGEGVRLSLSDTSDPIIGFYTTRRVLAPDERLAGQRAMSEVIRDWREGGCFFKQNWGDLPRLSIRSSRSLSWTEVLFKRRPRGYTFYRRDD